MARALNDDVPRVEASLFQRQQEIIRLRAIHDVVLGTMYDQERRRVLCLDHVCYRRRLQVNLAVLRQRRAEKLLADVIVRPVQLIVIPLLRHIIDAVEADHRLHARALG